MYLHLHTLSLSLSFFTDTAMERNDNLDQVNKTAVAVQGGADVFQQQGRSMKRGQWFESMKANAVWYLLMYAIALLLILLIVGVFKRWF